MIARNLCVRDLMVDRVLAVRPGERLSAVRELMLEHHVRHMPVVEDDGTLMGLISHRDLLRNSLVEQAEVPDYVEQAVLDRLTAREVMSHEVETVAPETDIREAAQLMFENKYGSLPVVEGERLVGILTESDFVRFLAEGD